MGNFERGGRNGASRGGFGGGDRGGFRGGRDDGRESRGPVTMHSAICASCKKSCEVPFRPSGDKPVYCRDCFAGRNAMGGDRSDRKDPRSFSKDTSQSNSNSVGNNEIKKQIEAINIKLDKILSLVHASTLKGTLKEITNESKENPKEKAPVSIVEKAVAKKVSKKAGKK